jgi:hypothetical protein
MERSHTSASSIDESWNTYCLTLGSTGGGRVSCECELLSGRALRLQTNPPGRERWLEGPNLQSVRANGRVLILTMIAGMLVILGIAVPQIPASAFLAVNVDRGSYEMRVHRDRTLSIIAGRLVCVQRI